MFGPAAFLLPAPSSRSRSIPSIPYSSLHLATLTAIASAFSLLVSHSHGFGFKLYAYPPIAKIILVSQGTAPSVSLHRVAASLLKATGTSMVLGLMKVKNKTLEPSC